MERIEKTMGRMEKIIAAQIGMIPAGAFTLLAAVTGFLAARVFPV